MATPLLRVSRPVSACARCRNAKIRCDGKLPACSACERVGKTAECSSANDSFAKGKERSYVASLELQVERLEKQIAAARAQASGAPPEQQLLALRTPVNGKRQSQVAEASDVDDLVSDFGYLVLNATSTGYNGFDKEMSFARLAISTATVETLSISSDTNLPARETTTSLIQECMQNLFSIYPVLTETSIYGALESMYQHNGQYSSPLEIWNIRLVIAIGLLLRSKSKNDDNYQNACRHVVKALEQQEIVLQPGVTSTTQAVLLLSLYSILDPAHFSPWYLLSIAARVWLDIGLHQEPAHLKRPAHLLQDHRRLFYCMYSLDRAITFSFVRLLTFTDDSIDVKLPADLGPSNFDGFQSAVVIENSSSGTFLMLTKFRLAQSRYYQKLFASRRSLIEEPWYNRPQDIVEIKVTYQELTFNATEVQRSLLGLDLHYLTILLLRPLESGSALDAYGIHLLFDAAMLYAQTLRWLLQGGQYSICCTSLELFRAIRVGRYLTDILKDQSCPIFKDDAPLEPLSLLGNSLPVITKRSPSRAISAVVDFCTNMEYGLNILGQRFGQTKAWHELMTELRLSLENFKSGQRSYLLQLQNNDQVNSHDGAPNYGSWQQTYQGATPHVGR